MAIKFLSTEWETEMKNKLAEEFSTRGKVTTEFVQVVTEAPDGIIHWMLLELEKGRFKSYKIGQGDIPDAELGATATYNTFKRVINSELDGAQGIMSGDFTLSGNTLKAMSLLGTYNRIEEVQRSIETEF